MYTHSENWLTPAFFFHQRQSIEQLKAKKVKELAEKIDSTIKSLDLSKLDFARIMGVQPSVITKWLSGSHNFTLDTLLDIEYKLNINLINTSLIHEKRAKRFVLSTGSNTAVNSNQLIKLFGSEETKLLDFETKLKSVLESSVNNVCSLRVRFIKEKNENVM